MRDILLKNNSHQNKNILFYVYRNEKAVFNDNNLFKRKQYIKGYIKGGI